MVRITLNIASEYGIMFLYDSKHRPEFPSNAGEAGLTSTGTCVAFSVLSYVDGDASVVLSDNVEGLKLKESAFNGKIRCDSKALSLFDSDGFAFVSVPLDADYAQVTVRMSESRNPDLVECIVENMAAF